MANDWASNLLNENVMMTRQRYEELSMLVNRNFILEIRVKELLKEISELKRELQLMLNQKVK